MISVYELARTTDQRTITERYLRRTSFTPRSTLAFNRTGVRPEDLAYPDLRRYESSKEPPEISQIRFNAAVDARNKRLEVVVSDYKLVVRLVDEGKLHLQKK